MAKKVSRKGKKGYATYKSKGAFFANKKRKHIRHMKDHPNDEQNAKTKPQDAKWSRKKPGSRTWKRSKTLMSYAHELRLLGYNAAAIKLACFSKSRKLDVIEKVEASE